MKLRVEIDLEKLSSEKRDEIAFELQMIFSGASRTGCMMAERYRSLFGYDGQPVGYAIVADEPASEALSRHFAPRLDDDPPPGCDLPEIET